MEVQFAPEVEKQLKDLATQTGRGPAELIQDVMAGYISEVSETHEMLNSRYDDIKSGKIELISGEDVEVYFREKSAAARRSQTTI